MEKYKTIKNEDITNRISELYKSSNNITQSCINACAEFGINYNDNLRRSFSRRLKALGLSDTKEPIELSDEFEMAKKKEFDKSKKRFIISWAQSETDVFKPFLNNMEAYAEYIEAEILIVAGRYRNPVSLKDSQSLSDNEKDNKDMYWDKLIASYLDANRHNIHKHLVIASDVKIQPTAETPLSGLNSLTGLESCIFGHPRVHFDSLPVLDGYPNKILMTTGSVTKPNYTDTKSGKKGEFHHSYGFVVAELDGDYFHVRQVTASEDGSFYDLDVLVDDCIIIENQTAEAMIFGDVHIGDHDEDALSLSIDTAKKLNVNHVILHDIFNGKSISPHDNKSPFELLRKEQEGLDDLVSEMSEVVDFFEQNSDIDFIVVRSNHDIWLDRWLNDTDWRKSNNKMAYLKLASEMASDTEGKGALNVILRINNVSNAYCLDLDESFNVNGFELGIHGHQGAGGSRGSMIQFKNLNTKNVTGHSHVPRRMNGALSVGTLTKLRLGYNKGLSAWMQSNVIIHSNGKAQHLNIINGKITTLWK
jgi:hypothetical protein